MNAAVLKRSVGVPAHPNEFDLKRIERALAARKRYRYVTPDVSAVTGGYLIQSPCCSRNVDADGGMIDIALLHHDAMGGTWKLFCKDHKKGSWEFHSVHQRLTSVTDELNADLERVFWQ